MTIIAGMAALEGRPLWAPLRTFPILLLDAAARRYPAPVVPSCGSVSGGSVTGSDSP